MHRWTNGIALLACWSVFVFGVPAGIGASVLPSAPNIIVINLDDAASHDAIALEDARRLIAGLGVAFPRAFVPNPLCCPSRAALFSGRQAWRTGVWGNDTEIGWRAFARWDATHDTLAERLEDAGYTTALFGKYLNQQPSDVVPPGWDLWDAFARDGVGYSDGDWVRTDGTREYVGRGYSTRYFGEALLSFIGTAEAPFFGYLAVHAPHDPATPEQRYEGAFDGHRWRPSSYDERDVAEKPPYIRRVPRFDVATKQKLDALYRDRLASLLTVDDVVEEIVSGLDEIGALANTVLVLTSDNGFLLGQHRWVGKLVPYDGSIRVPLWVRWDAGSLAAPDRWVYANIDVTATVLAAAGADTGEIDGRSFLVESPPRRVLYFSRPRTVVTRPGLQGVMPAYCARKDDAGTWIGYADGWREYYTDRTEMVSRLRAATGVVDALRHCHLRSVREAFR